MTDTPLRLTLHAPATGVRQEPDRDLQELADERLRELVAGAHALGLEEGRAAALADEQGTGRAALEAAAGRLDRAREEALEQLPREAVELAVAIAAELLAVEVRAENYDLERLVRGALAASEAGRGEAQVHVSPQDAQRLEGMRLRTGTTLEADPSLQPGEVHVSTPRGLLVREHGPALDAIREQLLEVID